MNDLFRRARGRAQRQAAPIITAARGTKRAKEARRALERARMHLRTMRSTPDEVLDDIVAEALSQRGGGQ